MLKKLFKIGMLAGALTLACSVNAQEKVYENVYPQYSWKSNWSFGGALDYTWQFSHGGITDWRRGTNVGFKVFAEKEVQYWWSVRFVAEAPGLWRPLKVTRPSYMQEAAMGGSDRYDRYGKFGADFKFDFFHLKNGYDPERKWNTYLFVGTGLCIKRHDVALGNVGMYLNGGVGAGYEMSEHSEIFAELYLDNCSDIPHPFHQWHDVTAFLSLGYQYNRGPSQEDLDLISQRAMLTQENFDAKDKEIEGLRNDLREAKTRENNLMNRIKELEADQGNIGYGNSRGGNTIVRGGQVVTVNNAAADSLQKIIDNYEANKYNFYALPFSILYELDEYTVSEDQMKKINAIAEVMKDNKDVKLDIIGYCDYSGSDAYNQKLSERRAENVKKLLVRKGISEDRLTTSGKGKTMSFGDIKNAINRRVSFYRSNN